VKQTQSTKNQYGWPNVFTVSFEEPAQARLDFKQVLSKFEVK
jgi:hypothetical protein